MKKIKNTSLYFATLSALALAPSLNAHANTVTAASEVITAYQVWASLSADCTNPIKVVDNGSTGKLVDPTQSVDFGSGTLPPDGTYNCLIIVLSDTKTIVPAVTGTTSSGATANNLCVAGTKYTQDTCGTGTSSLLPDGTTTVCGTGQNDKVAGYFSTTGTVGGDANLPTNAKLLNTPIVVAGASLSKTVFFSDPDGFVNQNGSCGEDSNAGVGFR